MYNDKDAKLLVKLGLTPLQAEVYLTLAKVGKATAKALSVAAKKDRADIYRVLTALQEQSLVEKIMSTPLEFRTILAHDGIKTLLERKTNEDVRIYSEAIELAKEFEATKTQPTVLENSEQIVIIPSREPAERKLRELGLTAQKIIYGTSNWDGVMEGGNLVAKDFKKHRKKNVQFKALIIGSKGKQPVSQGIKDLTKTGLYKLRWYPKNIPIKLIMKDGEEMVLATQSSPSTIANQYLWTRNHTLIAIIKDYFELMWRNSKEFDITKEKPKT